MLKTLLANCVLTGAVLVGTVASCSPAQAWSSRNTPEYAAEREATSKVPRGYSVFDAKMRSTKVSISIATRIAKGKQVNFKCPVRRQVNRNGSVTYYTGTPQVSGS